MERPSFNKLKQWGRLATFAVVMGIPGCAKPTLPYFNSTENKTTTAPEITSFTLANGECRDLAGKNTYVAEGDMLVGKTSSSMSQPFDDVATTGTETIVTGDSQTTLCAPYGGTVHQVASSHDALTTVQNNVYHSLRRTGCGDTTSGCTGGVQIVTVENGTVRGVTLRRD